MHLPTDEQYLQLLYEQWSEPEYAQSLAKVSTEAALDAQVDRLVRLGVCSEEQREAAKEGLRWFLSPQVTFRGGLIAGLRRVALHMLSRLPEHESKALSVPIGLLPITDLNGCAVRTPRGGTIIVINHGLITFVSKILESYLALSSWDSDTPYCKHHSKRDNASTIVGIANYLIRGDGPWMSSIAKTALCPSQHAYEQLHDAFCYFAEVFVLLHEYGHVCLGHLDPNNTSHSRITQAPGVETYNTSQLQEFEADEFAFKVMLKSIEDSDSRPQMLPSDLALPIGVLLKFFELCELWSLTKVSHSEKLTHPSGKARWEKIRPLAGVDRVPGSLAGQIDYVFATLHPPV